MNHAMIPCLAVVFVFIVCTKHPICRTRATRYAKKRESARKNQAKDKKIFTNQQSHEHLTPEAYGVRSTNTFAIFEYNEKKKKKKLIYFRYQVIRCNYTETLNSVTKLADL